MWTQTVLKSEYCRAGSGQGVGRKGGSPERHRFTVEMGVPSYCYKADRSSDFD